MRLSIKTAVRSRGSFDEWAKRVEKALKGPRTAAVGLVAGTAPGKVIDYGFFNHEGTAGGASGGGWGGPVPSRPFIKIAFHKGRRAAKAQFREGLRGVAQGKMTIPASAARLGQHGVRWIQEAIDSGIAPGNAPATVAKKGHGQTLIDTGTMRASISYKVR